MEYIIAGMVSMLEEGVAKEEMQFSELRHVCGEPDLHEFDDLGTMLACWEAAKARYAGVRSDGQVSALEQY